MCSCLLGQFSYHHFLKWRRCVKWASLAHISAWRVWAWVPLTTEWTARPSRRLTCWAVTGARWRIVFNLGWCGTDYGNVRCKSCFSPSPCRAVVWFGWSHHLCRFPWLRTLFLSLVSATYRLQWLLVALAASLSPFTCAPHLQKLYVLGGELAESAQKCTHLIASKVTRTVKFLTAISVVKHIVTPEWLEECFKCQKFIGE